MSRAQGRARQTVMGQPGAAPGPLRPHNFRPALHARQNAQLIRLSYDWNSFPAAFLRALVIRVSIMGVVSLPPILDLKYPSAGIFES